MNKENLGEYATQQEQAARVANESELAAEAAAAIMKAASPASRMYFQGFVNGLQAAEEAKKAG